MKEVEGLRVRRSGGVEGHLWPEAGQAPGSCCCNILLLLPLLPRQLHCSVAPC